MERICAYLYSHSGILFDQENFQYNRIPKRNVGEIPCPFAFGSKRQTNILGLSFFYAMVLSERKQHNIALAMLCATAIVWGVGFLLNKLLLINGFEELPFSLNAVRFSLAALVLGIAFCKKIRFSKQLLIFGSIGGLFLFGGFGLQIVGLKYTTPSSSGFFTVAYTLFVPFIAWIVNKRRPTPITLLGVVAALIGLTVLNLPTGEVQRGTDELLGNMLTLGGSLFFALQMILTDRALNDKKLDAIGMTVVQLSFCAVIFVLVAAIFESGKYATTQINVLPCLWQMAIVSLLGTAFAYFAQTFAQAHLSATETSIIVACESPIGAIFSVALGMEMLTWNLVVGGIFVLGAVVLMEILPTIVKKAKRQNGETDNTANNETDRVSNNIDKEEKSDDETDGVNNDETNLK